MRCYRRTRVGFFCQKFGKLLSFKITIHQHEHELEYIIPVIDLPKESHALQFKHFIFDISFNKSDNRRIFTKYSP